VTLSTVRQATKEAIGTTKILIEPDTLTFVDLVPTP